MVSPPESGPGAPLGVVEGAPPPTSQKVTFVNFPGAEENFVTCFVSYFLCGGHLSPALL